ncbi:autotransporter assembly complex protein TamA [Thiohalorhabdus denitrificans]|uniref:autotransporter assembly complex protein TamA n=1 Tax=Thiohalorhabdus denitrificans TaxID=381306 RepID=UPI00115F85B9|nr:autotransporter assembly complex family protein [Thiohalorhabdus denitrificans]
MPPRPRPRPSAPGPPSPLRRAGALLVLALVPGLAPADPDTLRLEVDGVSGELERNIRAYLSIAELAGTEDPDPTNISRNHRAAPEEIREALQPFGFYNPDIRGSLDRDGDAWVARYEVDRGPPTIITELELRIMGPGRDDGGLARVLEDSGLKEGERLRHDRYSATKDDLLEQAVASGYLDARFTRNEIRVHPARNEARVALVMDSGPAYYFGNIRVEQDILDPAFVERLLPVERAERLTSRRLLDLQFALSDTDYFERVAVNMARQEAAPYTPEEDGAEEARIVPVEVATDPKKPRLYSIGVGYGTDTGPRLTGAVEFRHINQQGHQFRTDLFLSEVRQGLAARYRIPIKNVRTDSYNILGRITQEELGDTRNHRYLFGVSEDRGFLGWQRSLYANVSRDFTFVGDDDRDYTFLAPGGSMSRSKADDRLYPRRGWSLFFDLHGAHESLLSDASFLQGQTRAQGILPLGPQTRLLGRVHAGATRVNRVTDIPASERFFAGGDRSVRGYPYQDLGPQDADGHTIGGRYLLTGSVEVDHRVWGNFGVAAFWDAGNASNQWPPDPVEAVGVGLRYASPLGMIRLDFATPQDTIIREDLEMAPDWRLHFSMGPDL